VDSKVKNRSMRASPVIFLQKICLQHNTRTIDLWFTILVGVGTNTILAVGAGMPAHIPDMFLLGCPTNSTSLDLLSSFLLSVLSAFDSVSCISCSLDSS